MQQKSIIIGIAGPSASGKSLLAQTLLDELGSEHVMVISQSSYYRDYSNLSFEERAKVNFDHPDAIDIELFYQHLCELQVGKTVQTPIYRPAEHKRVEETRKVDSRSIIVVEGILLFQEARIRDMMHMRIFMDAPLDICLIRRVRRDVIERRRTFESVLDQYENTVRPMFFQFIEPSKRYADLIIPRGGENRIAIDILKAKMSELLHSIRS